MSEVVEEQVQPKKKLNSTYIVGIVVILACLAFAIPGMKNSFSTYVEEVSEVRTNFAGQSIQVPGELLKDQITYDKSGAMIFFIKDKKGEKMKCRFSGTRPGNLDQAPWVVVQGVYKNDIFETNNLIVKCPDKYEGEQK